MYIYMYIYIYIYLVILHVIYLGKAPLSRSFVLAVLRDVGRQQVLDVFSRPKGPMKIDWERTGETIGKP